MSTQSGKPLTAINTLVTHALTLCEQFKTVTDVSDRSRVHEEAKHILNHQIPSHPGYALFVNKNSEFYEGYLGLCALVKHNETRVLEERFSKLRRPSHTMPSRLATAEGNGKAHSSPVANGSSVLKKSTPLNGSIYPNTGSVTNFTSDEFPQSKPSLNGESMQPDKRFQLDSNEPFFKESYSSQPTNLGINLLPYPTSPQSGSKYDKWRMPEPSNLQNTSNKTMPPQPPQHKVSKAGTYEVSPSILMNKMKFSKILLIDVRFHSQFEGGHINYNLIACFEPTSLRPGMTVHDLEDLLVIADTNEYDSFSMRSQVDLICVYDDHSAMAADSQPLSICCDILTQSGIRPYVLKGGFEAWERQYPGNVKSSFSARTSSMNIGATSYNPPLPVAPPPPLPPSIRQESPPLPPKELLMSPSKVQQTQVLKKPDFGESFQALHMNNSNQVPPSSPIKLTEKPQRPAFSRQTSGYADAPVKSAMSALKVPRLLSQQSSKDRALSPSRSPIKRESPTKYEIVPYTEESVPPLLLTSTGLKNLGNTCYMNCILQCLLSIPQLVDPFNNGSFVQFINLKSKLGYQGRFASVFSGFVRAMIYPQGQYFAPYEVKRLSGELRPDSFSGYDQQDCQEFLTFVLDGIHEDLNLNGDKQKNGQLNESEEQIREQMGIRAASAVEWERYLEGDTSLITDLFQGQYLSRLQCLTCKATSTTYNSFSSLSLPIVSPKLLGQQASLKACFDEFVKPELLDGDNAWFCPHCRQKRRTVKTLQISRLPPVLIIHLKRFKRSSNFNVNKLETAVDYPVRGLDLTRYWPQLKQNETNDKEAEILSKIPSRGQIPPFIYDLRAVTLHCGSLKGGHYTAVVQKPGRGWLYFDDSNVYPVKEQAAVSKNAYVLFYKRRMSL